MKSLSTQYLIATLGALAIGVGSLTAMRMSHTEIDQNFIGLLLAIMLPTLGSLGTWLRGQANGAAVDRVAEKVDVNTSITQATHETVAKVADSAIAPPRMPTRNLSGEFDR